MRMKWIRKAGDKKTVFTVPTLPGPYVKEWILSLLATNLIVSLEKWYCALSLHWVTISKNYSILGWYTLNSP
jgi:hypothetical protein